jgi:hypothetical protein
VQAQLAGEADFAQQAVVAFRSATLGSGRALDIRRSSRIIPYPRPVGPDGSRGEWRPQCGGAGGEA